MSILNFSDFVLLETLLCRSVDVYFKQNEANLFVRFVKIKDRV